MLDVLGYRSGTFGPTATYARRAFLWIPGTDPVTDPLGQLTIQLQHGHRAGSAVENDTYTVEEVEPERGPGRAFVLLSRTDPGQPEPYRVEVLDDRRLDWCTCRAIQCKVPSGCKHIHTLRALITEGVI